MIYLLICKCSGKQDVGETTDEFHFRCNNYKNNDNENSWNQSCTQGHIFKHFNSEGQGGFPENCSITLSDKTDGKSPEIRPNWWMRTLKTFALFGVNIEDSVWQIPCRSINVTALFTFFGTFWHIGSSRHGFRTIILEYEIICCIYCIFY